jgi:signal transduction histidine kinase
MIRRHAYEDQLLQARRLAEESNAAKAKFLSMMSHDLRTPLTAIDGNAQLLETGMLGELNSDQTDAVQAIREAARMQMTLIGDILDFARLESGRVPVTTRAVPVAEAITRAETLIGVQASDAGLRFTAGGCNGAAVFADPDRLQQILLNLLTNAVKFTPAGGEIALSCESRGDRVLFHVRDTGVGIPPENLQRIFSPFVQLSSADAEASSTTRGVGLGLAISRELARAMRGEVTAESILGRGSVFTVDLPAAPSLAHAGVPQTA